jgi:hypothetical protein
LAGFIATVLPEKRSSKITAGLVGCVYRKPYPGLSNDRIAKLARDYWPDIPGEVGAGAPIDRVVWIPYRCNDGPVFNFYHGAYYDGHPRPFFRLRLSALLSIHGQSRHSENVFLLRKAASLESFRL